MPSFESDEKVGIDLEKLEELSMAEEPDLYRDEFYSAILNIPS